MSIEVWWWPRYHYGFVHLDMNTLEIPVTERQPQWGHPLQWKTQLTPLVRTALDLLGSMFLNSGKDLGREASKQTRRIETEHSFICCATNEVFQG